MSEVPHRRDREKRVDNSVGEGMAGRAWTILEEKWFITVTKSKDAGVTQLRFQSRLFHFLTSLCSE